MAGRTLAVTRAHPEIGPARSIRRAAIVVHQPSGIVIPADHLVAQGKIESRRALHRVVEHGVLHTGMDAWTRSLALRILYALVSIDPFCSRGQLPPPQRPGGLLAIQVLRLSCCIRARLQSCRRRSQKMNRASARECSRSRRHVCIGTRVSHAAPMSDVKRPRCEPLRISLTPHDIILLAKLQVISANWLH
jgi:hypothetical protein